mmetsp:Transcript_8407/g.33199  ORF Transcript_8407/g.33199 Transcript_8407/m.33199 type:complete len:517 (+) Transcript_8407:1337-2887(+)
MRLQGAQTERTGLARACWPPVCAQRSQACEGHALACLPGPAQRVGGGTMARGTRALVRSNRGHGAHDGHGAPAGHGPRSGRAAARARHQAARHCVHRRGVVAGQPCRDPQQEVVPRSGSGARAVSNAGSGARGRAGGQQQRLCPRLAQVPLEVAGDGEAPRHALLNRDSLVRPACQRHSGNGFDELVKGQLLAVSDASRGSLPGSRRGSGGGGSDVGRVVVALDARKGLARGGAGHRVASGGGAPGCGRAVRACGGQEPGVVQAEGELLLVHKHRRLGEEAVAAALAAVKVEHAPEGLVLAEEPAAEHLAPEGGADLAGPQALVHRPQALVDHLLETLVAGGRQPGALVLPPVPGHQQQGLNELEPAHGLVVQRALAGAPPGVDLLEHRRNHLALAHHVHRPGQHHEVLELLQLHAAGVPAPAVAAKVPVEVVDHCEVLKHHQLGGSHVVCVVRHRVHPHVAPVSRERLLHGPLVVHVDVQEPAHGLQSRGLPCLLLAPHLLRLAKQLLPVGLAQG